MTQESKLPTPNHFNIPLSAKLFRLVTLKDDWDNYGSKAPTKEALAAIESIVVVPTRNGGVQFEFSITRGDAVDGELCEVLFNHDGKIYIN